ncbi:MAG: hypothetical protein QOE16_1437 [Microbacteriaceae bacterium]|nr:hypothetical protein [Microbacteriaceae bacterium]
MPIIIPEERAPLTSIIILAWKLVDELRGCLQSILDSADAPPYEVILVSNGARPEVQAFIEDEVVGAHIVTLPENIGFGGACNVGAAVARGRYVVMLNDDTIVEPGWLATITRAAAETGAEIIASTLLNANGTLQEAGSRVLTGAGTVQLGSGLSLPEAQDLGLLTRRQVDYGSGAALLVTREAFEGLGGFDPVYRPAYFEDIDLCFRSKVRGGIVLLEPSARVTHVSGGSTEGEIRFRTFASDHAGRAFIRRWSATLATAPTADAPLSELCTILPPVSDDLTGPETTDGANEADDAVTTALDIQRTYARWLNARLDDCEDAGTRFERRQEVLESELHTEWQRAESFGNRVHELTARLEDLDNRGPLGIIKWQVGVWSRKRSERRVDR